MTDVRSLLAFGPPTNDVIPPAGPRAIPRPRGPGAQRQGARLTPQFTALREALAAGRLSATASTDEQDPELVVVFDLAGTEAEFRRAVERVEGLELLAEMTEEDAEPDDEFVMVAAGVTTGAAIPDTLYAVMSNARAADQLIRLFQRWQADPDASFDHGLAPLKRAFAQLRAVRRWGPGDRIRDTGLLDAWREDVAVMGGQGVTRVEIELWFRADAAKRAAAQTRVGELVRDVGGVVVNTATIPAIRYHALLVDLPPNQVDAVLAEGPDAIALLASDSIALVGPAQPMGVTVGPPSEQPPPTGSALPAEERPRTALLDGLPLSNHTTLAGRLVVDDPDDVAARYTSAQQRHGTAMASLICHGDLSAPGPPLSTRLYVRPVMEPHPGGTSETFARDQLIVDLLHRCFHRMFEGDGSAPPSAPSVRIVNISLGDPARVFVRRMSPLATLLDWLAHRYNLLIVVSAGNHPRPPVVSADALGDEDAVRAEMLRARHAASRHRRLLSPAEAVNAVTVGALHDDGSTPPASDLVVDAVGRGMPAVYSASGSGHRRSVKPEVLLPGGRQVFERPLPGTRGDTELRPARAAVLGPGLLVAAPGTFGADRTAFDCGTSHATALATRAAHQILDVLAAGAGGGSSEVRLPDPQYHPVLGKALLVHAAAWGDLAPLLLADLGLTRRELAPVLGYGRVDPDRVALAARHRAVLVGASSIRDGQRQRFALPLPSALASTTEWRRVTVTLAWLSPVNPRSQLHRMAKLSVAPPTGELGIQRREVDHHAVGRGTVQHEVLDGTQARAFLAGDTMALDVDCRISPGWTDSPIRFGLVVSIEMAATVQADVHAQVRDALRARIASRTRLTPRG